MSMNLKCSAVDLPQIGTTESNLILSLNPDTSKPDGGWKGVARRYMLWVKHRRQYEMNMACQKPKEQEFIRQVWSTRLEEMQHALLLGKKIKFWIE